MSNVLKTALLLGAMSALLLLIGESLGGAQGLVIGFVFAVVTNFVSYWFSDKIVLKMYGAREVGPDHLLYQMVSRLAKRAGLPAAALLRHSAAVAECVRDRAQSRTRRRCGDGGHPAHSE